MALRHQFASNGSATEARCACTRGDDNLRVGHKCPILVETEMKGSHVTLYFGERMTVVRNPRDELKTGTLHAMCKQLGIRRHDL